MIKNYLLFNSLLISLFACVFVSVAVTWSYQNGVILAYGDAEAHLNIAKRVVDSLTPGFSQLGGVWLPLPHILMLPFVWNDFLWNSGLAGSIVSGMAFIWSSLILYRLAYLVTKNYLASFIAPLVFILNPNSLYLATTPMSEILLFATLISSMYFFIKWVYKEQFSSLILAALFGFLASLSRYDGWFLLLVEVVGIIFFSILKSSPKRKIEGKIIIFSTLGFLGIALWLIWNQLIFNNLFFFANSDYGSKTQQMWFYERGYLPTFNNLPLSFLYYSTDTYLILGSVIFTAGLISIIYYFGENIFKWIRGRSLETLSLLILLMPLVFYTVSLFSGQASQILPNFAEPWYEWTMSNVRYGVHMLIPAGIFMAYLARKNKIISFLFIILTVLQLGIFLFKGNAIAYLDGTRGLSSQYISKGPNAPPVEKWISDNYTDGLVLMDDYRRPISPVSSGVPMNKFISVGNKPFWEASIKNPALYAEWIILQKADTDAVWENLENKKILDDKYYLAFSSGNIFIYRRIDPSNKFVNTAGQDFVVNGHRIKLKGVNIYDLLQNSETQIDETFTNLNKEKINVVRIWGFNKEGNISEEELIRLDYILNKAKEKNIFIIITFGNQWDDYGGQSAYSRSDGDFFNNVDSIYLFEKHIDKFIGRTNSINSISYINDPTIAAWELLNEPRIEKTSDSRVIRTWIEKIGNHILEYDKNHMITVGTEGFIGGDNERAYKENHGANLNDICSIKIIDFCSVHLFPKYLKNENLKNELKILIKDWREITVRNNKPLYIGEVGFDLSESTSDYTKYLERENFFNQLYSTTEEMNVNAILLWNLAKEHDENYSLSFENSDDYKILKNLIK